MVRAWSLAGLSVLWPIATACGSGDPPGQLGDAGPPPPDAAPPLSTPAVSGLPPHTLPDGCPDLYGQEWLPTYEIDISAAEWAGLELDWANGRIVGQDDPELHPEHPLQGFRLGAESFTGATIRVRGNPEWWEPGGKMQFEISFNVMDPKGRFHGLRHVVLDSADQNRSFLRDRLALSVMRDLGVPAPCANNARLEVNGAYYGLYSNVEKVDKSFLKRRFADGGGNLFKRDNWVLKTNNEGPGVPNISDLAVLLDSPDVATLATRMDLDEAVREWAAEAVLPDADGAWAGGVNYYLYNEPGRGFVVIPWDLDATFTRLPAETDPLVWRKLAPWGGRPFYDLVVADPAWRAKYLDALRDAITAYDTTVLRTRIMAWGAQIAEAAAADPSKPFTAADHHEAVSTLFEFVGRRRLFLDGWLAGMGGP